MIVSFDPSGNWKEGKGTSGIAISVDHKTVLAVEEIKAEEFSTPEAYWDAHIAYLDGCMDRGAEDLEVVMEGFRLYGHKTDTQNNSEFETPQLIGILKMWCYENEVPSKIQFAVEVKNRWSDEVLEKKGIIFTLNKKRYLSINKQPLNNHKTDAVRHLMHYIRYNRAVPNEIERG